MAADQIHPQAIVESPVGEGTRVWAFAHIMQGARVGRHCNIGEHAFIETGAEIGDGVTVKNGAMIWDGVQIADGAFIGPGVLFTNDRYPRSARGAATSDRGDAWLVRTTVGEGASVGAGAVVGPGADIGEYAMVAAGAVVTATVPAHVLVRGVPASPAGWVCVCGEPVSFGSEDEATCTRCARGWERRSSDDGSGERLIEKGSSS